MSYNLYILKKNKDEDLYKVGCFVNINSIYKKYTRKVIIILAIILESIDKSKSNIISRAIIKQLSSSFEKNQGWYVGTVNNIRKFIVDTLYKDFNDYLPSVTQEDDNDNEKEEDDNDNEKEEDDNEDEEEDDEKKEELMNIIKKLQEENLQLKEQLTVSVQETEKANRITKDLLRIVTSPHIKVKTKEVQSSSDPTHSETSTGSDRVRVGRKYMPKSRYYIRESSSSSSSQEFYPMKSIDENVEHPNHSDESFN